MLYPVMPVYLKTIGFSTLLIGLLEGMAEATAGLSKGYFGNLSDRLGKRVLFVRFGYGLSAISKPILAAFAFPLWIFLARTIDRLGKGIRTSARDAILSSESTPETKGRVFGLHRALDTTGAFIGPIFALAFLYLYPDNFIPLFLIAFAPGFISISLSLFIREKKIIPNPNIKGKGFFSFLKYWNIADKNYKKLILGLLFFAIINSSDVFLLLLIKQMGYSNSVVIGAYIFYNLIYAVSSYPVGILADRIGLKKIFVTGLLIFSIVYGGFAFQPALPVIFGLFILYAIYAAATESVAKAWITNIAKKEDTATAIGFFTGFSSVFTLFASIIAGWLWSAYNPSVPFAVSSAGAVITAVYISLYVKAKY
ncbi:MFS transporter [bacterium]|nr:MAG: MFS transporter [bacterium]